MELKTIFSKRLKELRTDKRFNFTQHAMSEKLGISQQAYQGYENNKIRTLPKMEDLVKIAEIFNVPYEYLLGESNATTKERTDISKQTGLNDIAIGRLSKIKKDSNTDDIARIRLAFINELLSTNVAIELLNHFITMTAIDYLYESENHKYKEAVSNKDRKLFYKLKSIQDLAFDNSHSIELCIDELKRLLRNSRFRDLFEDVDAYKVISPYLSKRKKEYTKILNSIETLEDSDK